MIKFTFMKFHFDLLIGGCGRKGKVSQLLASYWDGLVLKANGMKGIQE